MFYKLTLQNEAGNIIDINDGERFQVLNCRGLTPPGAELFLSRSPNRKGAKFNGSSLSERNVEIDIKLLGDVEENRNLLYNWVNPESYCRINYSNRLKNVYCEGHVQEATPELFSKSQVMSVVVICGDPYLKSLYTIYQEISQYLNQFTFPFSIDEAGIPFSTLKADTATTFTYNGVKSGFKAQIIVKSEITRLQITNLIDANYFALAATFPAGTVILIDSLSSPKKVTNLTTGENLLKYMSNNSSWLKLLTGQNRFSYEVDTSPDDVEVTFLLNDRYLGV